MDSTKSVAIVGAGVSGLAAALMLVDNGFTNITIYEARREAGGRTRSYVDATTGDTLDNGQHLLVGCYTSTLDYASRIGTSKLILKQKNLSIPFFSDTDSPVRTLSLPPLPSPMNLIGGILKTDLLNSGEKFAAVRMGNAIRTRKLPRDSDRMTCSQFFGALAQPIGLVQKLWEPIVLATINARIQDASATLFVNVFRELFFTTSSASSLLFPEVGLSELLIDPALSLLARHGVSIRFANPVRAINKLGVQFALHTDLDVGSYDSVIWSSLSPPSVSGEQLYSSTASFSPIVNAYFWIDKPVLNSPIAATLGTTLQWVFRKPTSFGAQRLALTVSAAKDIVDLSNEEIAAILWQDIQKSLRGAREAKLLHSQIIKEKRATPLLSPQSQATRPQTETKESNFFLAGDIVQNSLPATIEGAVRNGYSAAIKVLRMLKQ